jgi:hypothetical protein
VRCADRSESVLPLYFVIYYAALLPGPLSIPEGRAASACVKAWRGRFLWPSLRRRRSVRKRNRQRLASHARRFEEIAAAATCHQPPPGHAGGVFFDALRGGPLALMVGISSRRPSTRLTRQVHEPPIAVLGVF